MDNFKKQLKQLNIELIEIKYDLVEENTNSLNQSNNNSKKNLDTYIKSIKETYENYLNKKINEPNIKYSKIVIPSSYVKGCIRCLFYNHLHSIYSNNKTTYKETYKNLFGSDIESNDGNYSLEENYSGALIFFDAELTNNSIKINIGIKLDKINLDNFHSRNFKDSKKPSDEGTNKEQQDENKENIKLLICHLLNKEYLLSNENITGMDHKEKRKYINKLISNEEFQKLKKSREKQT